jgi:flagellar hook assembly protein FlgD
VDVQGRVVRRAVLPAGSAGARTWAWDGRDQSGRKVAAGCYRVRAEGRSGGVSQSLVRLGD